MEVNLGIRKLYQFNFPTDVIDEDDTMERIGDKLVRQPCEPSSWLQHLIVTNLSESRVAFNGRSQAIQHL